MMCILVCTWFVLFTSLCALFIWTSVNVTSIVSITHTAGRKNNFKLNFFSICFVRNNKEIHLSFKNVKNSGRNFKKWVGWNRKEGRGKKYLAKGGEGWVNGWVPQKWGDWNFFRNYGYYICHTLKIAKLIWIFLSCCWLWDFKKVC